MKNINNYDSFLNEYYRGKNNTIGFRYSKANVDLDLTFSVAVIERDIEDVEEEVREYLDENLDEYELKFEIPEEEEQMKQELIMVSRGQLNPTNIIVAHLKFKGYAKTEAYSLLDNFMKDGELIILPMMLNDEVIDEFKWLPKAKKQIGF